MLINVSGFSRRRIHFAVCILLSIFLVSVLQSATSRTYVDVQRTRNLLLLAENKSFCSERSVRRGFNQHVLSVSAYESDDRIQLKSNLTWFYIEIFARQAKKFYPSWIVRVYYYNLVSKSQADIDHFEQLYENVDFCPAENLPVLGNIKNKLPGKIQRFLPTIDPFVGVTMVRDLDSDIFDREVQAVDEWLTKTDYAFHIMRDNSVHNIPMLGGLWDVASNRLSIKDRLTIANRLLPSDKEEEIEQFWKSYSKRGDQLFLEHHVWPIARQNALAHDSFSCFWSRYIYRTDTRPFPTRIEHPTCFLGCPKPCCTNESRSRTDFSSFKHCPVMCRPENHKDWIFC
ncbi:unnamed protein product [Adineta ricciae]|uniref:Uncharacterized protein n=1 Tax=Adineta ricciae TaxID=249248 RepID=A0A813QH26_ADIRI|nr:unnamed protein product [Adineta ricciae]CAF1204920.1 unnamed protein product [Adineta ricciae]